MDGGGGGGGTADAQCAAHIILRSGCLPLTCEIVLLSVVCRRLRVAYCYFSCAQHWVRGGPLSRSPIRQPSPTSTRNPTLWSLQTPLPSIFKELKSVDAEWNYLARRRPSSTQVGARCCVIFAALEAACVCATEVVRSFEQEKIKLLKCATCRCPVVTRFKLCFRVCYFHARVKVNPRGLGEIVVCANVLFLLFAIGGGGGGGGRVEEQIAS